MAMKTVTGFAFNMREKTLVLVYRDVNDSKRVAERQATVRWSKLPNTFEACSELLQLVRQHILGNGNGVAQETSRKELDQLDITLRQILEQGGS